MSFSLLRVPKKAALTALRGLVAGTSCTLLLITEDRRRRINQARSAIHNAERIRSSKQYHPARPAFDDQSNAAQKDPDDVVSLTPLVLRRTRRRREYKNWDEPLDYRQVGPGRLGQDAQANISEDVLTSAAVVPMKPRDKSHGFQGTPDNARSESAPQRSAASKEAAGPAAPTRARPLPRALGAHVNLRNQQPSPSLFRKAVPTNSNPRTSARPDLVLELQNINVHENVGRMREAILLGDVSSLEDAVSLSRDTLRKEHFTAEDKSALVQAAAMLCSKCQQAGMMDHAAQALLYLVELGPLAEADYYASNPLPVIDHAVSVAEAEANKLKAEDRRFNKHETAWVQNKLIFAVKIFLPMFIEGTLSPPRVQDWVPTAEKLMDLALDLGMINQAADAYWRIQHYDADRNGSITRHFMKRISEQSRTKRIVDTFNLIRYRVAQYDPDTWYAIGDLVADAAEVVPSRDPAKLLKNMVEFCPAETCYPQRPLRTTWVTKLLYCHWQRARHFERTLALFHEFEELGGFDKVVHLDGPYRVMIQIAVEAEQWLEADKFIERLQVVKPSTSKEARILGLLALAKAKLGDWNGVWDDFKKMEIKDRIEVVFSPVLHEFIKTHTTRETEDFLKAYIQDLEIRISPQMVNMVANRYGDIRDVQSFIDWLAYCIDKGFEIDAAFGNTILTNCRRRWDFGFLDLKLIYRTLHALSPKFVDDVTENDMISMVLRTHRRAKPPFIRKEVALMGTKWYRWGKLDDLDNMRVDMRHALATRNYRRAVLLYKLACKHGIPVDDGHLRIAVKASLKLDRGIQPALNLIKEAKARGIDVSTAITPVFLSQIHRVFSGDTSDKDTLLRRVHQVVALFEENDLSLGHQALLRAAYLLLQANHYRGAISFGLSALQRKGISYPDDVPTFQLLFLAYAYKADVPGMKWTIAGAVHMQYYHKKSVFSALKEARNLLRKQIQSSDVKEALWVVEEGLDRVRLQRLKLAEERKELESNTIEIMKHAALEAEQQTDSEAIRRRKDILQELDEKVQREKDEEKRRETERRAEMEARHRAAEELRLKNQKEAEVMGRILMESRHEIPTGF